MNRETLRAWMRQLRPLQWSKNLLLLLPALAAHSRVDDVLVARLGVAFALFSALASGLYGVNDVVDLEHDRAHPRNRRRPLAAGALEVRVVLASSAALVALSALGAFWLTAPEYQAALALYAALALAYTVGLKRVVVLDVVVLAALYTIRVVAGAAAVGVPLSRWFLAFSVFVFTSLALLKRAAEAHAKSAQGAAELGGRGWRVADTPVLVSLGSGCATAAALVYCLYITGDDVTRLYATPDALWLGLPVLLYWLSRAWLLALRGEVHEDPVLFALKDPASYASLAALVAVVWLAT